MSSLEPRVAVVRYRRDAPPDAMLAALAARLRVRGVDADGLLQRGDASQSGCCADLYLDDIGTGHSVAIFEKRGSGAGGCRLDSAGLAEAAGWLRAAVERRPDVLIVNRFGRREAEGGGLRDEIAGAVLARIPVVIGVGDGYAADWERFLGSAGTTLGDIDALEAWCVAQVTAMHTTSHAEEACA